VKNNKQNLTLTSSEAHLASLCVAIVSGGIGGALAKIVCIAVWGFYNDYNSSFVYWYSLFYAGMLGFSVSWMVCNHLFKSAHEWYGSKSWYHRIYDLVGVISGVGIYWAVYVSSTIVK